MSKPIRKVLKGPAAHEPVEFVLWWAQCPSRTVAAGRRAHYAEAFAAGQATRAGWIEPKPVVPPSRAQGSMDAWPFQEPHGRG